MAVEWGSINQPFEPEQYERLRERVLAYALDMPLYALQTSAGADPATALPVEVITERAWHSLFARQLFREPSSGPVTRSRSGRSPGSNPFPSATAPTLKLRSWSISSAVKC